jgi:hypothetical protein
VSFAHEGRHSISGNASAHWASILLSSSCQYHRAGKRAQNHTAHEDFVRVLRCWDRQQRLCRSGTPSTACCTLIHTIISSSVLPGLPMPDLCFLLITFPHELYRQSSNTSSKLQQLPCILSIRRTTFKHPRRLSRLYLRMRLHRIPRPYRHTRLHRSSRPSHHTHLHRLSRTCRHITQNRYHSSRPEM